MLRSMYSGISGMRGFQTKLDVIGNNIANVNTSGFKKGRVTFQDMMSQTTRGAQGATGNRGGINPMQVGLGSQVGSIDNIHTQGFRQTTGNPLDFAIEGNGMFVVEQGDARFYTRAGNFYLDDFGTIVNPDGLYLMGYAVNDYLIINHENVTFNLNDDGSSTTANVPNYENGEFQGYINEVVNPTDEGHFIRYTVTYQDADENDVPVTFIREKLLDGDGDPVVDASGNPVFTGYKLDDSDGADVTPDLLTETTNFLGSITIPIDAQSFSVADDGSVNYVDVNGVPRVAGRIALANFSNPAGLEKAGSNLFLDSANAGLTGIGLPDVDGLGKIVASALEMSNVDLAEEFTEMIVAQRGFQANTRIITTSDEILQELVNLKR